MRKINVILAAFVLLMVFVLPISVNAQSWEKLFYMDQFNDPTDEWYLTITVDGSFSNSGASDGSESVKIVIDEKDISLYLFDNDSTLVTNPGATSKYYNIAVKDSDGNVYEYYGEMYPNTDRIILIYSPFYYTFEGLTESDLLDKFLYPEEFEFYELLSGERSLKFAVTEEENSLVRYNFVLNAKDLPFQNEQIHTALLNRTENKRNDIYNTAVQFMEEERYSTAQLMFEWLGVYKDSEEKLREIEEVPLAKAYQEANEMYTNGDFSGAAVAFAVLGSYSDSEARVQEIQEMRRNQYETAAAYEANGELGKAAIAFSKLDYMDSHERALALWDKVAERKTFATNPSYAAALQSDGTIVSAKTSIINYENKVDNWKDIKDIVAIGGGEGMHLVALRADGTVLAVDEVGWGECDVSSWTDIVAVSAGSCYTVGLKSDGTVVAVGRNLNGCCNVSDWTDIVAVSAGRNYTIGLKSEGTVVIAGGPKPLDVSKWADIVAVDSRYHHVVGLKSDGTVVAEGENIDGCCDVSDWTDIVAVSAGKDYTIGLKSDGTVVATGYNYEDGCDVGEWTDIVAVSASEWITAGLKSDGTMVVTGNIGESGKEAVQNWTQIKLP